VSFFSRSTQESGLFQEDKKEEKEDVNMNKNNMLASKSFRDAFE